MNATRYINGRTSNGHRIVTYETWDGALVDHDQMSNAHCNHAATVITDRHLTPL